MAGFNFSVQGTSAAIQTAINAQATTIGADAVNTAALAGAATLAGTLCTQLVTKANATSNSEPANINTTVFTADVQGGVNYDNGTVILKINTTPNLVTP